MPDRRRHRGAHPGDAERFADLQLPTLRAAAADLGWLLDRGYADRSALELVGNRFALDARQRLLLMRWGCRGEGVAARQALRQDGPSLRGRPLWVDGFNVLTTVEAALSGGVLLRARDGCLRDLASMHGSWRRVDETASAAAQVGETLQGWGVAEVRWLLDRPVSNSGRLLLLLRELAAARGLPWQVELADSPDRDLAACGEVVATADGPLLQRCVGWVDLACEVVMRCAPTARVLELS